MRLFRQRRRSSRIYGAVPVKREPREAQWTSRGCFVCGSLLFANLVKPRRTQPNLRADPRSLSLLLFFDLLFVTLQGVLEVADPFADRKSTRLNSSHLGISYAVFCLKKKKQR